MGKIVNINENDLKKIVKRVLNERKQLNEEFFSLATLGYVAGAALVTGAGVNIYNWWSSGDAKQRAKSVFEMCDRGGIKASPIQTKKDHENLAKRYQTACPGSGFLTNCDEDQMYEILGEIESVGDLCGVINEFKVQGHGSMWERTESAMNRESEWEGVNEALTNAFRNSQEANEESKIDDTTKTSDDKSGGGSSKDYTAVSGVGSVSDLQQILKDKGLDIGSTGVDGAFGPATLKATLKALRGS